IESTLAADFACALAEHLSRLRAPVADERITWIADYEPLYYFAQQHKVDYQALCTAARAALASAPVAGEAQKPVAWVNEDGDPISDAMKRARPDLYGKHYTRPLFAAPQASAEAFKDLVTHGVSLQRIAPADFLAAPAAGDATRDLIAKHAELMEASDHTYFELARTRQTGWMAWLCSHPVETHPDRKVLARGQGETPDEACREALADFNMRAALAAQPGAHKEQS
ncbi:hypothetical protein KDH83_25830, partial [Achromobacter sp. Marseille-Q0513]|uniref:hypothetical protein n=1 Tax=Achromobacter sp. Marseille-Q0513 TaxID=2829161 RepID=UPI001B90F9D3